MAEANDAQPSRSQSPKNRSNQNRNRSGSNQIRNRNRSNQNRNRSNQQRNGGQRQGQGQRASNRERVVTAAMVVDNSEVLKKIATDRLSAERWIWKASGSVGAIVGVIVFGLTFWINLAGAMLLAVLTAVAVMLLFKKTAPLTIENNIGAASLDEGMLPRVDAIISGLCASMGVETPRLAVLDDPIPNGCAYTSKMGPTVVFTSGLIHTMSVLELEAVFAHLLAHVRSGSVSRGTAGAGMSLLLGPIGRRGATSHRWIGEGSLYRADELAVSTTRYPVSLAAALAKMEQGPLAGPASFFASRQYDTIRWLFVDPSVARRARSEEIANLDATSLRRQVLEER